MRVLLAILALTSCLAVPATARASASPSDGSVHAAKVEVVQASAARGPVGRFIQGEKAAARREIQNLKTTLADPARRRHFIGKLAVTTALVAAGNAVEVALRAQGLPPMGGVFVGTALPIYAQYYVQGGLAKLSSRWFAPPKKRSQLNLIAHSAFGGAVGVSAAAWLNGFDHLLPAGPTAARLDTTAGIGIGGGAVAGLRWGARKIHDRLFGLAAKEAKKEALHDPVTRDLARPIAAALK